MVDRDSRDQLAELLRHLVSARISTDEFELSGVEVAESSHDVGVRAVFGTALELGGELSIMWPVRMRGVFKLSPKLRRRMAIAIIFLHSQQEYEWPITPRPQGFWLELFLIGLAAIFGIAGMSLLASALYLSGTVVSLWSLLGGAVAIACAALIWQLSKARQAKLFARWEQEQEKFGDYDAWPFLRCSELTEALRHPRLLCGASKDE